MLLALLTAGALPLKLPRGGQEPLIVSLVPDADNANQAAKSPQKPREVQVREQVKPPSQAEDRPPCEADDRNSARTALDRDEQGGNGRGGHLALPEGRPIRLGGRRRGFEEVGRAPNGEVLYAAEWARKPTNTELNGYLPPNAPDGWGLIACRTVAGNRVEDCIELGQSPRGSRLASAVRQAAWQFRVLPPRRNGRPLIGSWVQIRIDYTRVRSG